MDFCIQLWEVLSTPSPTQQQIKSEFLSRARRDNPCYCRGQWIRRVARRWHQWLGGGRSRAWKIHPPKLVNSRWDNVMMAGVQVRRPQRALLSARKAQDCVPVNRRDVGEIKIKSAHPSLAQPCSVGPLEWLMDACRLTLLELMPGLHSRWKINKGPFAKTPPPPHGPDLGRGTYHRGVLLVRVGGRNKGHVFMWASV